MASIEPGGYLLYDSTSLSVEFVMTSCLSVVPLWQSPEPTYTNLGDGQLFKEHHLSRRAVGAA